MSQKIENILNLAFEATPEERARSAELDVGYDAGERAWDLIIKYSGSLDAAREISESVTELLNNYAVVRIREDRIEALASLPEVEFVEKPKSLYFQADVGRQVSCIDAVQEAPYDLTGRGVLVGIVDSGSILQIRIFGMRTGRRGSRRCGIRRTENIRRRKSMTS